MSGYIRSIAVWTISVRSASNSDSFVLIIWACTQRPPTEASIVSLLSSKKARSSKPGSSWRPACARSACSRHGLMDRHTQRCFCLGG